MNLYMLDTDTYSYIIRERPIGVLERFRKLAMEQICITTVTYAELLYGVERSSSKRINRPPIGAMDMMIAAQAKSLKTR